VSTIATYIRDQAYKRLTVGPIAGNWEKTRKLPIPTLSDQDLPCLSVFMIRENMEADGDETVGPPRFVCNMVLGISIFDSALKPDVLDGKLDTLVDLIEDTLLQDITFVSMKWTDGQQLLEGFPSIQRTNHYPQNGESYLMEARIAMTIKYRVFFEPIAPNAFTEVDVHAAPFDGTIDSGEFTTSIDLPQ
jgi:hypothetical protein